MCLTLLSINVVHKRLRHFRIQKPDSDFRAIRVHALKKIRTLVMPDPLASKLGRSLASDVGNLATEEEIRLPCHLSMPSVRNLQVPCKSVPARLQSLDLGA